jgi:predicted amidohydrolase
VPTPAANESLRGEEHRGNHTLAMEVAVVQLSSQDEVGQNLGRVKHWVERAAEAGAKVVALPENFAFMGEEARKRELAERLDGAFPGPMLGCLIEAATANKVWVLGGGMPEKSDDAQRPYNTSVLVDPKGHVAATYRKVHLFDVSLPDGTSHRESAATSSGGDVVTAEVLGVRMGLSICYDVRFPELYRRLVDQGARVITVPAAFTLTTGKDHWHALLRARAIENQVYVLAPAQHGKHPRGRLTYGKSLVVDPWGEVIAQAAEGEGFALARLDFEYQDRVRTSLPSLLHRKW